MDATQWSKLEALFQTVLDLSGDEREAFLEQACEADPVLRSEIRSLLVLSHEADFFFDHIERDVLAAAFVELDGQPGRLSADPYRLVGATVSHFCVTEVLGWGGMGVVYRARDLRLERAAALKFLPPHLGAEGEAKLRLMREAKVASGLDHPNIATVYEVGETEHGQVFIAMACYEGETLKDRMAREVFSVPEAVAVAIQVAEGLAEAHRHGIVHRDVKPANLMLTPRGGVKILDFGLAELADVRPGGKERAWGTVAYMSPEQAQGQDLDSRTDLWSLGVVLYEMLAGKRPFQGADDQGILEAIRSKNPEPLPRLRPEVPEELAQIIEKALAKRPEARYQRAEELLQALHAVRGASEAEGGGRRSLDRRRARRRYALYGGGVLLLFLLALVLRPLLFSRSAAIDSVAVLPLVNLSGDPEHEYLADGMTDALIDNLGGVKALRVISRTSMMRYKVGVKSLPEVARELGVAALLEGTLQVQGEQVRIAVRLIEGATERPLWAQTFDRELRDVLVLQREAALAIAQEVAAEVTPLETVRLGAAPEVDPKAYLLYLKGTQLRYRQTEESYLQAIEYFEQAVALDPNFAPAYAAMEVMYASLRGYSSVLPAEEAESKARWAVEKALMLDPNLSDAYLAKGHLLMTLDWEWAGAEQALLRAIELNPGNAMAHFNYSKLLARTGRLQEALVPAKQALHLNPLSPVTHLYVAGVFHLLDQHAEAITYAQHAQELDSTFHGWSVIGSALLHQGRHEEALRFFEKAATHVWGLGPLGHAYGVAGRRESALQVLDELKGYWQRGETSAAWGIAMVYTGLGERQQALDWLERAYEVRSSWLINLKAAVPFRPLHPEPRFQELLEKLNLDA